MTASSGRSSSRRPSPRPTPSRQRSTARGDVVGRPFGAAVVREPRADIGIGPLLFVSNVDIGFDFTSLPFRPDASVDFAYRNYGGREEPVWLDRQ